MSITELGEILAKYADRYGNHTFSTVNIRVMKDGSGRIMLEPENEIITRFASVSEIEDCIRDIQREVEKSDV